MSNAPAQAAAGPSPAQVRARNRQYLLNTIPKWALATQQNGQGTSQTYAAGSTLNFAVPTALNAFLEGFEIHAALTVTLGAGTSAVYGLTPAGREAALGVISVDYNGLHQEYDAWIMGREHKRLQGRYEPEDETVLAGDSLTLIQNWLDTGSGVSVGANTWTFKRYFPLNWLHPLDARGMLPIMHGETPCVISLRLPSTIFGVDPANHSLYGVSGSGHTATVTGTITIVARYRDGETLRGPNTYQLNPFVGGTCQVRRGVDLTGIAAAGTYRKKFDVADQIYWAHAAVIDGNQSNKLSVLSNISVLELVKDEMGASAFWRLGTGSNLSIYEWFWRLRDQIKQDPLEGFIPVVRAPIDGIPDATEKTGQHFLNTALRGWPDARLGVQLATIGAVTGITPRVMLTQVYNNRTGLQVR